MTPSKIREALIDEARRLSEEGAIVPAQCLLDYTNLSTDEELTRLREVIVASPEPAAVEAA